MKVMVALQNRFYEGPSGEVYSNNVFEYSVWQRYLQVFDEVVIFARVGTTDVEPDKSPASGPGVSFFRLPMYIGPKHYLRQRSKLIKLAAQAPDHADAFILRIPGRMGTLLWRNLRKRSIPFAVEVVGHSGESAKTCGANILLQQILKHLGPENQRRQCREAAAAAYVSRFYLQEDYPPGGWSTYYSSIDLREADILTEAQLDEKIARLREPFDGVRPFRICHAGTMEARYKGQDVLIKAVAQCVQQGLDVELALMGDGKFRPLYQQEAENLGIADRVRFLGNVPAGQAVRDEYDKADMLVFPSLTEGLPKAVIEAMARGLPCVASKVGGIPELLDVEFLANPGDENDLAQKIRNVIDKCSDIGHIAKTNLEKSKEYKHDILNTRRVEFYQRVKEITLAFKKTGT